MPENSTITNTRSTPLLLPGELLSIATLLSGIAVAVMAITCRWFVSYQGQAMRLLLVAAGVTAALILVSRINATKRSERVCVYGFAALSVLALWIWSPGFAFAVLVSAPVLLTILTPALFQALGYELGPALNNKPATFASESLELPATRDVAELMETTEGTEAAELTEDMSSDSQEDVEDDPWAFLQKQFQQDESLAQNVAQWIEPDGTCCVVANIRFRFSTVDETCIVHLPFWPILEQKPEVFCRVVSGPESTVKTTRELPHGLRLEARLNDRSRTTRLDSPVDLIVEVVASVSPVATDVAA